MATIKPKRGTGAPTGLVQHELAVNTAGRVIYLGNTGGTGDIVASHTTVRGLSGTVGVSAGSGIAITNSGNSFSIALNAFLSDLRDVKSTISTSANAGDGFVFKGGEWTNTPVVLSLNGSSGDVTAVTSLSAAAGISLSGSSGDITIQNIGVVSFNGLTGVVTGLGTAAAGSGVSISGTTSITISNTGVTGLAAGSNISISSTTGNITVTNQGVRSISNSSTSGGTYGIRITSSTGTGSFFLVNTGVTHAAAGSGISVSGATGTVTISNTGVTGVCAGTGISVSAGTGRVTITNEGVRSFNGLTGAVSFLNYVSSFNGSIGDVQGVGSAVAGSGISVSGATGAVTITNAGVTGITGTANEITVSGTTGFVTIGLPDSITVLDLNTDQVDFNTNPGSTAMAQGRMLWDSVESTVGLGMNSNVTCKIGENLYKFAHNNTGSPINKGEVVYVSGSQGETLLRIAKAQANAESTSATTVGVAAETIAHGATGFVTVFGLLTGIATNTIVGSTAGGALYLSEATAGALRAGLPTQPNHGVRVGFLVKEAGAGSGSIFVNVQNYQELEELSDVFVSGVTSNHMLLWDSTDGRWENRSPTDVRSALDLSSIVSSIRTSSGSATTGGIILAQGSNVTITQSGNTFTFAASLSGASAGVTTLNGLSGAVTLSGGKNIGITLGALNTITISYSPDGASFGVSTIGGLSGAVGLIGGTGVSITTSGNTFTVANTGVVSFGNSTTSGGTYGIRVSGTTGSGVFLTNTGVTTAVAGTGISVSGATGTVTITNQGVRSFSASTSTLDTVQNLLVTPSSGTGDVSLSINVIAVKTVTTSGSGINASTGTLADEEGGYVVTISNTGVHAINNPKTASGGTYGVRVTGNTGSLEIINTGVTFAQAGSGISVSGATGTVTITNTGLTGIAKSGGAYATGNVTLVEGSNITITQSGSTFTIASSGGGGGDVSSVNGATGAITLVGGTDISITPSGSTFTIAYTGVGGPGGGVSTVNGLSGAVGLAVGLGLTLTSSGNTLNIAGLTATTSQIGVAYFDSTNFSVSGGKVSITAINGGTF